MYFTMATLVYVFGNLGSFLQISANVKLKSHGWLQKKAFMYLCMWTCTYKGQ